MVDLFCGAGGLSSGFSKAGFEILYANDIDLPSILTYRRNHPHTKPENIVHGDIDEFIRDIGPKLPKLNIALVMGGPPCQGFSMANRQRLVNDPRNVLFKKFIEVIKFAQPKYFLMENVKGMLQVADLVLEAFNDIGYSASYKVLNARDFGIPQNRERLIYIGARQDLTDSTAIADIFTEIAAEQQNTEIPLKDALWGLRKLSARSIKGDTSVESEECGFTVDKLIAKGQPSQYVLRINSGAIPKNIYNHKARYNNARDLEIFRLLPPGEKSDHASIEHIMPYKSRSHIFKDKYYKLHPDKVSKTITSHMKFDCNMYIHPFETRGITPREAARIQSFPDDYVFEGPYTQWYNQIGNAVPPLMAEVIANKLKLRLI